MNASEGAATNSNAGSQWPKPTGETSRMRAATRSATIRAFSRRVMAYRSSKSADAGGASSRSGLSVCIPARSSSRYWRCPSDSSSAPPSDFSDLLPVCSIAGLLSDISEPRRVRWTSIRGEGSRPGPGLRSWRTRTPPAIGASHECEWQEGRRRRRACDWDRAFGRFTSGRCHRDCERPWFRKPADDGDVAWSIDNWRRRHPGASGEIASVSLIPAWGLCARWRVKHRAPSGRTNPPGRRGVA